jgi:predicted RNA binding protein YcfA (HicA-like mRNA interferase family)
MPPKIRELKAALMRAGFVKRPAKGSHLHWVHPDIPRTDVTIAGHDGDDAQDYQIKQVQAVLKKVGGSL